MPHRPRILITTATKPRQEGLQRLDVVGGLNYAEAVLEAGGLPFMIPNLPADNVEGYLAIADGLILAGGEDLHPKHFGEEPSDKLGDVDETRDALELGLYRSARDQKVPVLGICRGIQLINVAEGGSLHQHLPDLPGNPVHEQEQIDGSLWHHVHLERGSRLHRAYGSSEILTNSYHHQAIDRLGRTLRVSARDEYGLVEGIENVDTGFVLGIQWHPEMSFANHPEQFAPFAMFMDEVNRHALIGS